MKKLFILAMVAGAFSMTSCKKDYTCECKDATGAVDPAATYKQNSSKASAKTWCTLYDTSYKIAEPGGSCSLK